MHRVCIGIHVHSEAERLRATLSSVRANTTGAVELLLLPDGPDEAIVMPWRPYTTCRKSGTEEPLGAPACFNRLVASTDASVLVLLESGSLVGPAWLTYLLAALDADSRRNGLAGPSTNHAWNAQGVFPWGGGTPVEIAQTAREAARRFGSTTRTLEPLYSLADFCYVVRREVVEVVGAADESYGLGPCWEMDYNIRAARAGFRGYGPARHMSIARHSRHDGSTRRRCASKRANIITRINFVACGCAGRRQITGRTVVAPPVQTSRPRL